MATTREINDIEQLAELRAEWRSLLERTPGASYFQSLEWLEAYWRHFGEGQTLRAVVVSEGDHATGIIPLTVRTERTRVGRVRVLTYPLHDWGSFYGPIGPSPKATLAEAMEHVRRAPRDWDYLELRWLGSPDTDPTETAEALRAAGLPSLQTVWDWTALVDFDGTWESYLATRAGARLRRLRHAERQLAKRGEVAYLRYRPAGEQVGDGDPRWDLYDACERIAERSWQGTATNGTTLSHPSVRGFLREVHASAAAAGAVDLNLLLIDGEPVAFVYGYRMHGRVYGLRRGYDAELAKEGAGNVLLARTLHDGFLRRDQFYDMGVGSFASKRHFQTRVVPILRCSHFSPTARSQLLRLKRWVQSRRTKATAWQSTRLGPGYASPSGSSKQSSDMPR